LQNRLRTEKDQDARHSEEGAGYFGRIFSLQAGHLQKSLRTRRSLEARHSEEWPDISAEYFHFWTDYRATHKNG
jgi:hypothetical protein